MSERGYHSMALAHLTKRPRVECGCVGCIARQLLRAASRGATKGRGVVSQYGSQKVPGGKMGEQSRAIMIRNWHVGCADCGSEDFVDVVTGCCCDVNMGMFYDVRFGESDAIEGVADD